MTARGIGLVSASAAELVAVFVADEGAQLTTNID